MIFVASAAALILTAPAAAAAPGPCTSVYAYHVIESPLRVGKDLTIKVRNPYGPKVNIGRFFVQFRIVYASAADRAKAASVQWVLDGQLNRFKRGGGRDAYLFGSFHLTPGAHVIDATITPKGGAPVTAHIRFTATGCEPSSFAATADHRRMPGHQPFGFWVYSGDSPIRRIQVGSAGARVSTAASLRGRKVGELYLASDRPLALRLPMR